MIIVSVQTSTYFPLACSFSSSSRCFCCDRFSFSADRIAAIADTLFSPLEGGYALPGYIALTNVVSIMMDFACFSLFSRSIASMKTADCILVYTGRVPSKNSALPTIRIFSCIHHFLYHLNMPFQKSAPLFIEGVA